jgi:uridine kinase
MSNQDLNIKQVSPRSTVEIHLGDGRVFSGPRGSTLETFLKALPEWNQSQVMGAIVNSELRELTYPIQMDARVQPLFMADADGARIYRRSVTFLLEAAFEDSFPNSNLEVDHSVSSGGFYCEAGDGEPFTLEDIKALEKRMHELVEFDLPIKRLQVPLEEAVDYFKQIGQHDKIRLLKYRRKPYLVLYQLENHRDYLHGYMVPSTGYLRWFDLQPLGEGFVLRFPRRHRPTDLLPMPENENLVKTFRLYGDWLKKLGIHNVGSLNNAIQTNRTKEVILVSEAFHEQRVSEIASGIMRRQGMTRIILIAGPSSSGKTTFSRRLAVQLLALGGEPFALELDSYFVDREATPFDENGNYDFESLHAINTDLLNEQVKRLIDGEEVQLPHYNFKAGRSEPGDTVKLSRDQIIILEGIHGLNPELLPQIPQEKTYRIYTSCLTQLNLDTYNRISTTDTRLIRRIVRDMRERGYDAQQTIQHWESVRRGEKRYIFPYQENADEMFNSALTYELSALKPLAEPLLRQVPFGTPEHIEAKRLLAFLEWFIPLDVDLIPENSILREFIGGSILSEYKLWTKID